MLVYGIVIAFWQNFKYKNLTLVFLGIILAVFLSKAEALNTFLLNLGSFGYLGAFFAGMLFVSTSTVATGAVLLAAFAKTLSPLEIGLIAGLGAVVGDFTIFRFVKGGLFEEITPFYNRFGGNHLTAVLNSKYFHWTLPVIGAIIIASPFPDELGVSLMGISKMKTYQFVIVSFILNTIGIFLVVSAALVAESVGS